MSFRHAITAPLCFALLIGALFIPSVPAQAQVTGDMLQCMADCIVAEGKSEAATCKSSCAGSVDMSGDQQPVDCMASYKQCKKACGSEKSCKKVCKEALMSCH